MKFLLKNTLLTNYDPIFDYKINNTKIEGYAMHEYCEKLITN